MGWTSQKHTCPISTINRRYCKFVHWYFVRTFYKHPVQAMINKALLKTHIIGGLTHGHGEYAYLSFGEFPQDSNLTLSILLSILNNINRKEHRLPDTLYLQMDNCSRENKNKYVYGVLGYLVLKGIFRKVSMFIIDTLYNVKCTFISRYDFHSYQLAILMRT